MKKKLTVVAALVLVLVIGVTGTLAYLTSTPAAITNTFTVGNVKITLSETKGSGTDTAKEFQMIPGSTIEKDPTVTVKAGSEACWVFVKVEKSANYKDFLEESMNTGWTALSDPNSNVYWCKVAKNVADDQTFPVLMSNQVKVKTNVTQEMMDALQNANGNANLPTLKFTAYAIQQANIGETADNDDQNAAAAWTALQNQLNPTP